MRIALITDGVHPYVMGGMQRHTFYLCKYLSRNGVQVTLVHFNQSEMDIEALDIFDEEEKKNIESIIIPFPKSNKLPGHYVRASYQYSKLIYEKLKHRWSEFDFIYTKGFSGWKLIEEKIKNPDSFPPIGVKFHGYEMFQKQANYLGYLKSFVLRGPVRYISKHADYVFSYGSKITQLIQSLGVISNRIIELPAGIEKSWISERELLSQTPRVFTYLGRYERRKGIEELNSVLIEMLEEGYDFLFNFIGPFEEIHKVKNEKLIYHGSVTDNRHIMDILDKTDFLVCPSWSEGMPNVILEGMARGTAIIASDVGAVNILLDQNNGFLIEAGNKNSLKKALKNAITIDHNQLLEMKRSSIQKIRNNFHYETIISKFINTIHKTLNK